MAEVANQETTSSHPNAEQEASTQQNHEQHSAETNPEQGQFEIPSKFVGKTAQDVIRSYVELEKQTGKVTSEKAHRDKELEEMRQRYEALQSQFQQIQSQASRAPSQEQSRQDELPEFESVWEKDPKEAVKVGLKSIERKALSQFEQQQRLREAQEYYNSNKASNPDFAALEQDMGALAQRYRDIIKPEYLNSRATIEALFLAAQGAKRSQFEQRAIEAARSKGDQVRAEKRSAFSESATSNGEETVDFSKLSLEDMRKMLSRHDD